MYTLIFLSIRKRSSLGIQPGTSPPPSDHHHHKAFLLYPVIYVVCTAPIALGRIVSMANVDVPISYFCVAGALITSNGWLDVLLWGLTRRNLLFFSGVDSEDTGLDTFTFMRTPRGRKYGNIVWVEGASGVRDRENEPAGKFGIEGARWGWPVSRKLEGWRRERHEAKRQSKTASQESLRGVVSRQTETVGMGIQMDLVTSVVVERDVASRGSKRVGKTPVFISLENGFGKYTGAGN